MTIAVQDSRSRSACFSMLLLSALQSSQSFKPDHAIFQSNASCRYGGIFAIGMAYRGTANNAAIQRLLHFAVSDVSDNVRRAAVMNLGFLLMGVPQQCPRIVSLLSESYNPHVRYGITPVPQRISPLILAYTRTLMIGRPLVCIIMPLLEGIPYKQAETVPKTLPFVNRKCPYGGDCLSPSVPVAKGLSPYPRVCC